MRIKKLELFGFKSFAERQVLHFDAGITGVVGPNGCGKSNIVDALLRVMGEHNAKNLRGNNMQDIIFNGSQNRNALGFAEVVLTLENDGKNVPPEYENFHEIEISRRLYRAGDSEFEINKRPCRLKDITDLFLGTGVGSRAYSIIEQGRVGQIISAKPEERRHIIDEAAGITKYKSKRAAAERKIDETKVNLSRVNDIIKELEGRLTVLDKQAKKAKRYKILKEEIKGKDFHHASLKWLESTAQENFVDSKVRAGTDDVVALENELKQHETVAEQSRIAHKEQEQAVNLSQKLFYESHNSLALAQKDLAFLQKDLEAKRQQERSVHEEIKRLNQRQEDTQQEKETIAEQINETQRFIVDAREESEEAAQELAEVQERHLRQRELTLIKQREAQSAATEATTKQVELKAWQEKHEVATRRSSGLNAEKKHIEDSIALVQKKIALIEEELGKGQSRKVSNDELIQSTTAELENTKSELRNAKIAIDDISRVLTQKSSRLASFEEIDSSYEWSENKLGPFLSTQPKNSLLGIVADYLAMPAELESAAEIALKQILESVVVTNMDSMSAMCVQLSNQNVGRIRLYPKHKWPATEQTPNFGSSLLNYARPDCDVSPVKHILERILLVENLEIALKHWPWAQAHNYSLLTHDGAVLNSDGSVSSGKPLKTSGLLKRKREMRELAVEVKELTSAESSLQQQLETLKLKREEQSRILENIYQDNRAISIAMSGLQENLGVKNGEFKSLMQKQKDLAQEESEFKQLFANATLENESRTQSWASALELHKDRVEDLEDAQAELADLDQEMLKHREQSTVFKVRLAEMNGKLSSLQESDRRMSENLVEFGLRTESLNKQAQMLSQAQAEGSGNMQGLNEHIEHINQECVIVEERLNKQKLEFENVSAQLNECETLSAALRNQLRSKESELNELKLSLQQHRQARLNIDERIYEKYGVTVKDFVADYHLLIVPLDDLEKNLQVLRRSLENLGAVNPQAEEEFDELNSRYVFLKAQGDDLKQALDQLQEAIVKINRATTKCFSESFHAINARFSQVFPRLFNGGKAWLALTDPDDLLNTGVEIYAEPPGKKLASIALMSGGEKALTATSLIFAIFLIKPSPFCLLDEVDAPLDEANVQRFSAMVQEISAISQFIVITHNKKTMEGAQKLYGITMETPGVSKTVSVNLSQHKKKAEEIQALA